jgi:Flp pilus assembly CpaE family ATPase
MSVLLVTSPKGGSGASVLATNLALALCRRASCLLVDLHADEGIDDLLMDLSPDHGWRDLLSLLGNVTHEHFRTAAAVHPSGLLLLSARRSRALPDTFEPPSELVQELADFAAWTVVDLPPGWAADGTILALAAYVLLVATMDPPCLRCVRAWLQELGPEYRGRLAVVLNQVSRQPPAPPAAIAASLEVPLLAVLPADPAAVGNQIHFGVAAVHSSASVYGRAVERLAHRLVSRAHSLAQAEYGRPTASQPHQRETGGSHERRARAGSA